METIRFSFDGQGPGLISEVRKIEAELRKLKAVVDDIAASNRASGGLFSGIEADAAAAKQAIADTQLDLAIAREEDLAAGRVTSKQAADQAIKARREQISQEIELERRKQRQLRQLQLTDPSQRRERDRLIEESSRRERQLTLQRLRDQNQLNQSNNTLRDGVTQIAAKYFLALQALQAFLGVARGGYNALIRQNVELQEQLLGTQASLASTNRVLAGGVEITDPTAAIQALEGPVNDAIARIREGSLELVGVTSAQLVPIFQNIAGQSAAIGASLDDSADLTLKFAAALGTLNIPLEQQRQEVSSILQANITTDSILAKTLGINNEMVRAWKAQGTAVDEINKRLETFQAGNALGAQAIGGVASNIKELFENISLEAGQELTEQLAKDLSDLLDLLRDNQDEILAFVQGGVEFFEVIYDRVKNLVDILSDELGPTLERSAAAFDEDTLDSIELLINGIAKAITLVANAVDSNPLIQYLLRTADITQNVLGSLARISPEFLRSAQSAGVYAERTAAIEEESKRALEAIQNGEAGAAKARDEAIAKIDDQIAALKESSLAGVENRNEVKRQVEALEELKGELSDTGEGITLVSKSTEQLTNDLKLLTEQFQQLNNEAALAESQLNAAVERSLEQGLITEREAAAQRNQVARESAEERLQIARDREVEIRKLLNQGPDLEQQKQFNQELVKIQTDQAKLELEITKSRIADKQRLEDQALKDLEDSTRDGLAAIGEAETQRAIARQELINAGVLRREEANLQELESTRARIQAEIQAEEQRAQRLAQLEFDDPAEQIENARRIQQSRQRLADLTLQALQNEKSQEEAIATIVARRIDRQLSAEQRQADARLRQLTEIKSEEEQITNALDRRQKLAEAQARLEGAQANLRETTTQIEVDRLDRALELRRRLNDEQLSPEVRRVLQDQLRVLTGRRNTGESEIIARQAVAQERLLQARQETLVREQETARQQLETEIQRERLAARRQIIETQIAEVQARIALSEAQANRDKLLSDPNASTDDIARANDAVAAAEQSVGLAQQAQADAFANLEAQERVADVQRETLRTQQQAARAQNNAATAAELQANQLKVAEASATRLYQSLRDAARIRLRPLEVDDIPQRSQSVRGAASRSAAVQAESVRQVQPAAATEGNRELSRGISALVDLARQSNETQQALNANILRVAGRPVSQTTVVQQASDQERVLRGAL